MKQLLTFKTDVAVQAVNTLNRLFKETGTTNRAFLENARQVEIEVPSGFDVDLVDGVLDDLNGVYGEEWFQAEPSRC